MRIPLIPLAASLITTLGAAAQGPGQVAASDTVLAATEREPIEQQIALIRTAAPDAIVDHASIWVLGARGYELAREGTNGFSCLSQRGLAGQHRIPRCDDANGVEALYPVFFLLEEMRAQGRNVAEYRKAVAEGYGTGRLRAPRYGGISYMYSTDAVSVTASGTRAQFTPHVMIYWPYCSLKDLGVATTEQLRGTALNMLDVGTPECHLIINTPPNTARSLVSSTGGP